MAAESISSAGENALQTIRVFFEKKDIARYLSHLDLMRCFTRAVKRTGADVWYTEGFNPHLYLMFPAPLSLGFESEYEVVDMRMEEEQDLGLFVEKLNEALPSGIQCGDPRSGKCGSGRQCRQ